MVKSGKTAALATVVTGVVLLFVGWFLTTAPFLPKTDDVEAHFSSSSGVAILHGGAFPWLAQFIGLSAPFVVIAHRFLRNRKYSAVCVAVPLFFGLLWWSGLVLRFLGTDRLGLLAEFQARQLGGGSLFDDLFLPLGAIVNPVRLHGPFVLSGIDFFWTALSTTLVLLWWGIGITWVSRTLPEGLKPKLDRRGLFRVAIVVFVYFSPSYLKTTISLL